MSKRDENEPLSSNPRRNKAKAIKTKKGIRIESRKMHSFEVDNNVK